MVGDSGWVIGEATAVTATNPLGLGDGSTGWAVDGDTVAMANAAGMGKTVTRTAVGGESD